MSDVVSRYIQLLSHEINNPLTVLCGQSALMRASLSRPEVDRARLGRAVDQVEGNVNRVIELVRELREALRVTTGEAVELTPLAGLVRAAVGFVRRDFVSRGIELEVAPIPEDVLVAVGPLAVRGVLWRLLGLAFDRGGPVRVDCALATTELKLFVRDSGPPVNLDSLELLELAARLGPSYAGLRVAADGIEIHFPRVD